MHSCFASGEQQDLKPFAPISSKAIFSHFLSLCLSLLPPSLFAYPPLFSPAVFALLFSSSILFKRSSFDILDAADATQWIAVDI